MSFIKKFWEKWKIFGHKVGNFQARLILSLFYFIVICPFAVVVKFGSKPLRLKICTPLIGSPIKGKVRMSCHEHGGSSNEYSWHLLLFS